MRAALRYDMRNIGPLTDTELYRAVLDQATWADQAGFATVYVGEHHGDEDGYIPSPMVLAAAIAARTERIEIHVSALLLPLHDPIRLAEDLSVLSLLAPGRLAVTFGIGYRQLEFAVFGVDHDRRIPEFEKKLKMLLSILDGEKIDRGGYQASVTPRPAGRLRLYMGGSSRASARRAVEFGLGYRPAVPGLWEDYQRRLGEVGRTDDDAPAGTHKVIFVVEDEDTGWNEIGPYLMHTNNTYAAWASERQGGGTTWVSVENVADLRRAGRFLVVTPSECREVLTSHSSTTELQLYPAISGLPPEIGWKSLYAFAEHVLPYLPETD